MSENVQSAMYEILKRIQADVGDVKRDVGELKDRMGGVEGRLSGVETRLTTVATVLRKMRHDNAGMLVMMRATAGHFEQRVSDLETKMEDVLRTRG
jgi:SMC interacting uncharacterized protein involved in chromosome segregation